MPKPRRKKQPEQKVHDRRANDVLAALRGQIAIVEVDDPLEAGARDNVIVSLRDDPLRRYKVRGFIDQAQFEAGREWQNCYEAVEIGRGQGIDYGRPKVDGGGFSDPLSERRRRAARDLERMGRVLGQFGEAIFRKVLGERKFMEQVVREFGYEPTQRQIDGFSFTFRMGLENLAKARGLAG
jgi:hypothetical protein